MPWFRPDKLEPISVPVSYRTIDLDKIAGFYSDFVMSQLEPGERVIFFAALSAIEFSPERLKWAKVFPSSFVTKIQGARVEKRRELAAAIQSRNGERVVDIFTDLFRPVIASDQQYGQEMKAWNDITQNGKALEDLKLADGRIDLNKLFTQRELVRDKESVIRLSDRKLQPAAVQSVRWVIRLDENRKPKLRLGVEDKSENPLWLTLSHATLNEGVEAVYAGEIFFDAEGRIAGINGMSGHYMAPRASAVSVYATNNLLLKDYLGFSEASKSLDNRRVRDLFASEFGLRFASSDAPVLMDPGDIMRFGLRRFK